MQYGASDRRVRFANRASGYSRNRVLATQSGRVYTEPPFLLLQSAYGAARHRPRRRSGPGARMPGQGSRADRSSPRTRRIERRKTAWVLNQFPYAISELQILKLAGLAASWSALIGLRHAGPECRARCRWWRANVRNGTM